MEDLPAALDANQGGSPAGTVELELPSDRTESGEHERDFTRTFHGGGIALSTPDEFMEMWPVRPEATPLRDISATLMGETVEDFYDQLSEAVEELGWDNDHKHRLNGLVSSGILVAMLTLGPALDFAMKFALTHRILQPYFVVVLSFGSIRIATLGYVGEHIVGVTPSEQHTDIVLRLLTENLINDTATQSTSCKVHYRIRPIRQFEHSITACVAQEVPEMVEISTGQTTSSPNIGDCGEPRILLAGVSIPPDGITQQVEEGGAVTWYLLEVTPADGSPSWHVQKRYQEFRDFYEKHVLASGHTFAVMSFPRKHFRKVEGTRLEARRRGLQQWLVEVLREAQSSDIGWLAPLRDFLEVP